MFLYCLSPRSVNKNVIDRLGQFLYVRKVKLYGHLGRLDLPGNWSGSPLLSLSVVVKIEGGVVANVVRLVKVLLGGAVKKD